MKFLTILWQRLVDDKGQTCDRCETTYEEMQKAVELLKKALSPLAIEVTVEQREIDKIAFANDPSKSNRVFLVGFSPLNYSKGPIYLSTGYQP